MREVRLPARRTADQDWCMGQVIHCGEAARDPKARNLLQIADVDSGEIRWVNADLVTNILPSKSRQ